MARNMVYQQGDRINICLSRDLTPEFIEWLNKQSDLSNFFLYAAQQLYQQTGFVYVSAVMPRKINFDLSSAQPSSLQPPMSKPLSAPVSTNLYLYLNLHLKKILILHLCLNPMFNFRIKKKQIHQKNIKTLIQKKKAASAKISLKFEKELGIRPFQVPFVDTLSRFVIIDF
ncbi:hypothetical protein BTO28_12665 [Domibacillus epiphyticus]|uniref:Uncharacterized protein n=1 Tax=Domibacillus epiphyticus TaxID=1714355 RepID=A0A1V2A5M5_9BACI|nr:hypothetical protein BTO28_12665 [Domibacillus epiphyticus]